MAVHTNIQRQIHQEQADCGCLEEGEKGKRLLGGRGVPFVGHENLLEPDAHACVFSRSPNGLSPISPHTVSQDVAPTASFHLLSRPLILGLVFHPKSLLPNLLNTLGTLRKLPTKFSMVWMHPVLSSWTRMLLPPSKAPPGFRQGILILLGTLLTTLVLCSILVFPLAQRRHPPRQFLAGGPLTRTLSFLSFCPTKPGTPVSGYCQTAAGSNHPQN